MMKKHIKPNTSNLEQIEEAALVKAFDQYLNEQFEAILEASSLSKTGMPKEMVSAIHQKEEHKSDRYEKLGYVNRGKRPLVVQYKYFAPSHDIEVGAPLTFTGKKVADPTGARKSMYPDFAQYLIDIPKGPIRVLITRPEDNLYMYLYHKSERVGGEQYAILIWDKDKQNVADYGFVGLTTTGVDRELVREVHKTKGGNTNMKIQEIVFQLTSGGPSNNKPVQVYEFQITKETEPRAKQAARKEFSGYATPSLNVLEVFANKYINILPKLKPSVLNKFKDQIELIGAWGHKTSHVNDLPNVTALADALEIAPHKMLNFLFKKMAEFRRELFEAGRDRLEGAASAYSKTSGYELEEERNFATKLGINSSYSVKYSKDPKDLRREEHHLPPERRKRSLPDPGEIASIESIIKHHKLDGTLHRFSWFILTDKITAPAVSILAAFGVKGGGESGEEPGDFGTWVI